MGKNYTSKDVFKMSIPIFVELLLQLLVGNVDQFMLSHYSQNAVAAIGNGNQIMNVIIIVLNVMSVATTVLISQYLGANDKRKINEVCNVSLVIIGAASLITTLFLIGFYKQIFVWLKVPADILGEAASYLLIVGSFITVQGMYMVFAAILRSFGMLKHVMWAAAVMNILNIIGNAILINGLFFFPRLGIAGAAISTNISKCVGLAIVVYLFLKKTDAKLSTKYISPFPFDVMKKILGISLPAGGEALSYNMSQIYIFKFINIFGTAVIATKVYCSMLANIAYVYSTAIAEASQIVVGYFAGANQPDKINKRVKSTIFVSLAFSLSITLLFLLNSNRILGIFTHDPVILELGRKILLIEFFLEIGRSINITMTKCLVAVGDVNFPVIVGVICMWGIAVLGSYIIGVKMGYGLVGIWIAMAIDEAVRGTVFVIRFKSQKWRKRLIFMQKNK